MATTRNGTGSWRRSGPGWPALGAGVVLAASACVAGAQTPPTVVDAAWAAERLGRPDLVVFHVGSEEGYEAGHLPGARRVTPSDLSAPTPHPMPAGLHRMLEMPDPTALVEVLEGLGISDDSEILVTFADGRVSAGARVAMTLAWAGLGDRTRFLDGGVAAWTAAGGSLTREVPAPRRGRLTLRPTPLVVEADFVQGPAVGPGHALVDGRAAPVYRGEREDRGLRGHIPGAVSLPFPDLLEDDGRLRDDEALRELFRRAGVREGDVVVAYCHIGQMASGVLLAASRLGHEVRLYDGSMDDWAMRGLPVERGGR